MKINRLTGDRIILINDKEYKMSDLSQLSGASCSWLVPTEDVGAYVHPESGEVIAIPGDEYLTEVLIPDTSEVVDGVVFDSFVYDTPLVIEEDDSELNKTIKDIINRKIPLRVYYKDKKDAASFNSRIQELKVGKITLYSSVEFLIKYLNVDAHLTLELQEDKSIIKIKL
jgi:hypothetical protein